MNHYSVDLRYRPNINRPGYTEKHLSITAPNRDTALLMAGHRIGVTQPGIVPESVQVTVTRMHKPGSWS